MRSPPGGSDLSNPCEHQHAHKLLKLESVLELPRFRVPTLLSLVCSSCIGPGSALWTGADHPGNFIRLPGPSRANSGASYASHDTKRLDVNASTAVGS